MEVGLVSCSGGFLTAEGFGDGVSVLGTSLGKNQTWILEEVGGGGEEEEAEEEAKATEVRLWGAGGRRQLVSEADGAVRCLGPASAEEEEAEGCRRGRFVLAVEASGAWVLREAGAGGRFLESDGEDVFCLVSSSASCSRAGGLPSSLRRRRLWMPRLAAHPHVALFHPRRRRFAREDPELGRLWADARSPRGPHCAFLLRNDPGGGGGGGGVHVETAGRRFLGGGGGGGRLSAEGPSAETALQLSLRPGGRVCLADRRGRLLFPQGPRGLIRPGDRPPRGGEEWFLLRRSPAAVGLLAARDGRRFAVLRDGRVYAGSQEAAASPAACSSSSSFLLEFGPEGRTVQLQGPRRKYLAQRPPGMAMADGGAHEPETRFEALWLNGRLFLRGPDGRFLGTAPRVGLLVARAPRPGPDEELALRLDNRPFLVLRGRDGFVGSGGGGPEGPGLLRGDRLEPDCVELLPCQRGVYHLRSRGKGFWALTPERRLHSRGKAALDFRLELRGRNLVAIRGPNGRYLRGDPEGPLVADREEEPSSSSCCCCCSPECLWEF